LPPALASWLAVTFSLEAFSLRDLGLQDAKDLKNFIAARAEDAIIVTKK
jgi:predicted nuclease of predicted toxin-antitoxin system